MVAMVDRLYELRLGSLFALRTLLDLCSRAKPLRSSDYKRTAIPRSAITCFVWRIVYSPK